MEKAKTKSTGSEIKIIHVKILDGNTSDVFTIGKALDEFSKTLPFELKAIVSNDNIQLQDVDTLLRELYKLKKELLEEMVKKSGDTKLSNLSK